MASRNRREEAYDEDQDTRYDRKKFKSQNLQSPGYLASDLPNQLLQPFPQVNSTYFPQYSGFHTIKDDKKESQTHIGHSGWLGQPQYLAQSFSLSKSSHSSNIQVLGHANDPIHDSFVSSKSIERDLPEKIYQIRVQDEHIRPPLPYHFTPQDVQDTGNEVTPGISQINQTEKNRYYLSSFLSHGTDSATIDQAMTGQANKLVNDSLAFPTGQLNYRNIENMNQSMNYLNSSGIALSHAVNRVPNDHDRMPILTIKEHVNTAMIQSQGEIPSHQYDGIIHSTSSDPQTHRNDSNAMEIEETRNDQYSQLGKYTQEEMMEVCFDDRLSENQRSTGILDDNPRNESIHSHTSSHSDTIKSIHEVRDDMSQVNGSITTRKREIVPFQGHQSSSSQSTSNQPSSSSYSSHPAIHTVLKDFKGEIRSTITDKGSNSNKQSKEAADVSSHGENRLKTTRSMSLSTDTALTSYTLTNPDVGEVLFCVAAVIQAQIFEDDYLDDSRKALHPEFNVVPDLPPDMGGHIDVIPDRILTQESANDVALRTQLVNLVVPTIDTVVKYLALIRSRTHYAVECNIIALIYLNRITTLSKLPLTMKNWRALWITCVIIAQKFWEDNSLKTSAFHVIIPSIAKHLLRQWEKQGLELLDYSIRVKPSLYAKYYFELRQLFVEIIGPRGKWSMKPSTRMNEGKLYQRNRFIFSKDDSYEGTFVDIRGLKSHKK